MEALTRPGSIFRTNDRQPDKCCNAVARSMATQDAHGRLGKGKKGRVGGSEGEGLCVWSWWKGRLHSINKYDGTLSHCSEYETTLCESDQSRAIVE